MVKINRRAGTQDVSWFLDQYKTGNLDLDPPYQRRSVWTSRDRRYFLDTLFRGYPCPPIYLHKTIDEAGNARFHVVDGKQRIETVVNFANNKVRIPENYGDERMDNKRWKDVLSDPEIRNSFLNYSFVTEYFDDVDSSLVNEIFERMNKNSRKLTNQELRNARYDGWFSRQVESEADELIWKQLGVVTTGRARRMADIQFLAELFMVIIDRDIIGFDHDAIDKTYADHEDITDPDLVFDAEEFMETLSTVRAFLVKMYGAEEGISTYLSSVSNMYVLWSALVLNLASLPQPESLAADYLAFMKEVAAIAEAQKRGEAIEPEDAEAEGAEYGAEALTYFSANQSATTELPQRQRRLASLEKALGLENQ